MFSFFSPALAAAEAKLKAQGLVEGLEAKLLTLREGIVDLPTTEGAVERAQVRMQFLFLVGAMKKTDAAINTQNI